ncbi:hypothetical protein EW026_g8308 [Hermanssonia centrifuga]|uniref:Uncharacterized protein n=1 Tax=Hermanssonia centrifuga TaxID=98765 RepID=A0A4S4K4L8_9APHY|nr:hypothetical protein EW026_g8308 [Hermanssonia centrifuga]
MGAYQHQKEAQQDAEFKRELEERGQLQSHRSQQRKGNHVNEAVQPHPTMQLVPMAGAPLIPCNHKQINAVGDLEDTAADFQIGSNKSQAPPANIQGNTAFTHDTVPHLDDIKTQYHPNSGLATRVDRFKDYNQEASSVPASESDQRPWFPYRHLQDFVACELALESCMNEGQIDRMLNLINSTTSERAAFSLKSYSDMKKAWDMAANILTPVHSLVS